MLKKALPMNPVVARTAVKPGKTAVMVVVTGITIVFEGKELFIMQFVPVAGLKPRFHFNPNRIVKFYAGIVSVPEIIIANCDHQRHDIYHGVFFI
jgi:hypothetical protein